jgi:ribosomal protein S18 acetylase RimI-like enzyme
MNADPTLRFEQITEADVPELTAVMTRAFDDDSQKHLGKDRGGPPGYDDGGFFEQWLFGYEQTVGYKILVAATNGGAAIAGAVIVWDMPDGNNYLGTIFVDPAYQDRGIGTRAWQYVEAMYPEAKSWQLGTPIWATKNHHFYEERCGFSRLEVKDDEIIYRKEMPSTHS